MSFTMQMSVCAIPRTWLIKCQPVYYNNLLIVLFRSGNLFSVWYLLDRMKWSEAIYIENLWEVINSKKLRHMLLSFSLSVYVSRFRVFLVAIEVRPVVSVSVKINLKILKICQPSASWCHQWPSLPISCVPKSTSSDRIQGRRDHTQHAPML